MTTHSISQNLVYQRKLKGYTQEELSEKTQVTVRTIQRIEKGDVNPHLQTVRLLAAALSIEVDDLLVLEDPKEETVLKKWLLLLHATPILGLILPFCNILFPLFIWIHKREDNKLYNSHGIKVINFQISMTILFVIAFIALMTIEGWGFLMFIAVIPFTIIVTLYNIFWAVNKHKCYYPLAFPFLKQSKNSVSANTAVVLLFSFCLFTSFNSYANQDIKHIDGTSISKDSLTQKVEEIMRKAKVTGIEIAIFNQNEIAYKKAFGYANLDKKDSLETNEVLYGASLSKAVFGYIVATLVNDGIIDLDKPLQEYLDIPIPEMKFNREWKNFANLADDERYKIITGRMCLTHTTGFPNWRWISRTGEFNPEGKIQIYTDPGTHYSYSGEGMQLLQHVVEHITGKGLEELARERVFIPLKMERTSYLWQKQYNATSVNGHTIKQEVIPRDVADEAAAAGSMETTLDDYTKFVQHILKLYDRNSPITQLMFKPNI
ncbi:MAG: serine hydrolase, partial [Leeuwenhoekiella sp.]